MVDPSGHTTAELTTAAIFASVDGPLPIGDLVAAGIVVYVGGKWVVNNWSSIKIGAKKVWNTVTGWFKSESEEVDWDVSGNSKNHVLRGTGDSHVDGWKQFGIDPNNGDNNEFLKTTSIFKRSC